MTQEQPQYIYALESYEHDLPQIKVFWFTKPTSHQLAKFLGISLKSTSYTQKGRFKTVMLELSELQDGKTSLNHRLLTIFPDTLI